MNTESTNLFSVAGRAACVAGASGGLGRRAAAALARAGARVVGVARREEELRAWQDEAGGETAYVVGDLADRDSLPDIARRIAEPFGAPDIFVCAAAINPRLPMDEVSDKVWDHTLALNLTAPFFLSRALAAPMIEKGWGRIVHFASLQTFRAFPNGAPYGTTKAGVAQLTRALAEAWSRHGVNVNAIGPGFFPTELTKPVFDDKERAARNAAQTCIGRNGEDADLDGPLLFLCSDASRYVTGQTLMLDGGFTAK